MSQRFKNGDPVLILPKFAHLYPISCGVVVAVTADPFRSMFNGYTIQFADGSTDDVFEFQIIEDLPSFKTQIAVAVFDSEQQLLQVNQLRGPGVVRQLVLRTPSFDTDIKVQSSDSRTATVIGQVLERNTSNTLKAVDVSIIKAGTLVQAAASDSLGVFTFNNLPRGALNILIVIPGDSVRILGEVTI